MEASGGPRKHRMCNVWAGSSARSGGRSNIGPKHVQGGSFTIPEEHFFRDRRSVLVERWIAVPRIPGSTPDVGNVFLKSRYWVATNTEGGIGISKFISYKRDGLRTSFPWEGYNSHVV